jgi:replication factor C subunit 3/5
MAATWVLIFFSIDVGADLFRSFSPHFSCAEISDLQTHKGVALVDILQQLHPFVFRISMPPRVRVDLLVRLADTEHRLAYGTSEKLQLGAVCGAFAAAKEGIVAGAQ